MNREEILAMKPGPELDALVAKKVMGWIEMDEPESTRLLYRMPKWYSTHIGPAWLVVEQLKDRFRGIEWYTIEWRASFGIGAYAPTVPEAICKAALLAVLEGET